MQERKNKKRKKKQEEGVHGVMVTVQEKGHGNTSSNSGGDCISHSAKTPGKGINPTTLSPVMVN